MIWPFSRRSRGQTKIASQEHPVRLEFVGRMVRIPARDFFGSFSKSPNGEYLLAWRDADPTGRRGGYRESGKGDFLLIHGGQVAAEGRMERPKQGQVADNGTFILSDWRFGDQLRSTIYAFNKSGKLLIKQDFGANAFTQWPFPRWSIRDLYDSRR